MGYFPLRLGTRRLRSLNRDASPDRATSRSIPRVEAWREGVQGLQHEYEEHPEREALAWLQRAPWSSAGGRFWLVLGEPGAGKTTLLTEWCRRWVRGLGNPSLGLQVPVLVRLRELDEMDLRQSGDALADRLWRGGLRSRADLDGEGEDIYRSERGCCFRPVWLLDGLDEVPSGALDEALLRTFATLPGKTVLSCRTAIYESLRRWAAPYQEQAHEYEVLGLTPPEQLAYLVECLGGDTQRAARLHGAVQENSRVRGLASNPLMLDLIARVPDPAHLPATRAAFYRGAVEEMWARKLGSDMNTLQLAAQRDRCLKRLAYAMGMETVEEEVELLFDVAREVEPVGAIEFVERMRRSGLLRVDRERFSFVHLAIQEYYLACACQDARLERVLLENWGNARFEETLGLLVSLLGREERWDEVHRGIRSLVERGWITHLWHPRQLWRGGRSPLRVALHVLSRAGVDLGRAELNPLNRFLWKRCLGPALRRQSVAADPATPLSILVPLAADPNEIIRGRVAGNPSTPPEILARLAMDPSVSVRGSVAGNRNAPLEALAALAADSNERVRESVARNPSTPPETLSRLAVDPTDFVRQSVARNRNTPAEALVWLATDPDRLVRESVARNPSTPPGILAGLAADRDDYVLRSVAGNRNTPAEALVWLATDPDRLVRESVARNPSTPPEILAWLATDPSVSARRGVAESPSTPPEALAQLTLGSSLRAVQSPSTSPEILARLATDPSVSVRGSVAGNRNAPPEVLAALAADPNEGVRWGVAANPSTPPERLASLAADPDVRVRARVTMNPSTRPEVLASLAADPNEGVRWGAAWNSRVLLEDLSGIRWRLRRVLRMLLVRSQIYTLRRGRS